MDTHGMLVDLIRRGPKVRSSRKGRWVHRNETNPDGKGGYVIKEHDVFIKDNQRSRFTEGKGWWRNVIW